MPTYRIFTIGRDQHSSGMPKIVECVDDNEAVDRNVQHAARYTELSPTRFKDFWRS